MISTDISGIESIIKLFNKFYKDIIEIKETTDFSEPDNIPKLQASLINMLEHHTLNLHPHRGQSGDDLYSELLYLLTVFTDEIFINIDWQGEYIWQDHLLEERIFNSHVAGLRLFDNLEKHINHPVRESDSMIVIYYLVLCLGFKGKFMHRDFGDKLKYYRKQLYALLYKSKPFSFQMIKHLFPGSYKYTFISKAYVMLPNYFTSIGTAVTLFLALLVFTFYIVWTDTFFYYGLRIIKFFSKYYLHILLFASLAFFLFLLIYALLIFIQRYRVSQIIKNTFSKFEIRESFRLASKLLRHRFETFRYKYEIPWYMIIGTNESGSSSLMNGSNLKKIMKNPFDEYDVENYACKWWFYEKGLVIDVANDLDPDNKELPLWKFIIRKLKSKRRRRPLDGLIITIGADTFISPGENKLTNLDMIKIEAARLEEKILYLQQKLKMRIPVYLVITKCDIIEGYKSLIDEIPKDYHDQIFGWSNPYNPNAYSYSKQWVSEAFLSLNYRISYLMFGFFSNGADIKDFPKIFQFKNNLESIKYPVQIFANKIFSANQYSPIAPLLLRGVYFTGAKKTKSDDFESEGRLFVKDLFDKKIFNEKALAKPHRKVIVY
jgi:type IV/VI secretion system ImpK/VasF family protein